MQLSRVEENWEHHSGDEGGAGGAAGGGNVAVPAVNVTVRALIEGPSVNHWANPTHELSFQPSPSESYMLRVHAAPFVIVCVDTYGAPPAIDVPSLHDRVQDTSSVPRPPPTCRVAAPGGSGDGEGGGRGGRAGGQGTV